MDKNTTISKGLKTGLTSVGVTGLPGLNSTGQVRTYFMSIDDVYVSEGIGSEPKFNKNLRVGDIINLYSGESIFSMTFPFLKDDPAILDKLDADKINVITRIQITQDIMKMPYSVFKSLYVDRKSSLSSSLLKNHAFDNKTVLFNTPITFGIFNDPKTSGYWESRYNEYLVDYASDSDSALTLISGQTDKSALICTSGESNKFGFSNTIDPKTGNSNIIFDHQASPSAHALYFSSLYLNNNMSAVTRLIPFDSSMNFNAQDLMFTVALNKEGLDISFNKNFDNLTLAYFGPDKKINRVELESAKTSIAKKPANGTAYTFWVERDSNNSIQSISKAYSISIEDAQSGVYSVSEIQTGKRIENSVNEYTADDPYITITHDKSYKFFGWDNDSSKQTVTVSIEKNKDKEGYSPNLIIDSRYKINIETAKAGVVQPINPASSYSKFESVKVESNTSDLITIKLKVRYPELDPYNGNLKDYYMSSKVNTSIHIDQVSFYIETYSRVVKYTIQGYTDYIKDTNYRVEPIISPVEETSALNDLNKSANPNAIIIPFRLSFTALDVERLKSNGCDSVSYTLVFNDFYSTGHTLSDKPVYKAIVTEPGNMSPDIKTDSFGYGQSITYGVLNRADLGSLIKLDDRQSLIKSGALQTETKDSPFIRANNTQVAQSIQSCSAPLSVDISFKLDRSSLESFSKDVFLYLEFQHPVPSIINVRPHVAKVSYFAIDGSEIYKSGLYNISEIAGLSVVESNNAKAYTYNVHALALTVIYRQQEIDDNYSDLRVDNRTRRVVGSEDKIKVSLYPLKSDKLILPNIKKYQLGSRELTVESTYPVLRVSYNKYPLLPDVVDGQEIVKFNDYNLPSMKYEQFNQNAPLFYRPKFTFDIIDKDLYEVKTKWDAEYNYLNSNRLLSQEDKDITFTDKITKESQLLSLTDSLDIGQFSDKFTLKQIKSELKKPLFDSYISSELNNNNSIYDTNKTVPDIDKLFRCPLYDIRWMYPIKDNAVNGSNQDSLGVKGIILNTVEYADKFRLSHRFVERTDSDYNIMFLRCPSIENDDLDNIIVSDTDYVNCTTNGKDYNLTDDVTYSNIHRYFNYYTQNSASSDLINLENDIRLMFKKNKHYDIEGIQWEKLEV